MKDLREDPAPQSARSKPPPGSDCSDSADTSPRTARFCDNSDDPCRMCKEMANVRVIRSDDLLQGQRELFIIHGNQIYRLLRTRNDKLILQK